MMNGLALKIAEGVSRHALTLAGGWLVNHGFATNDQAAAAIGGVIAIAGIIFSAVEKAKAAPAKPVGIDTPERQAAKAALLSPDQQRALADATFKPIPGSPAEAIAALERDDAALATPAPTYPAFGANSPA